MDETSPFEPTVLGAMWKYRWLVFAIVVAFTSFGVFYANLSPTSHRAVATLVVEDPRSSALFDVGSSQNPQRYVSDQAAVLQSSAVAQRAAENEPSIEGPSEVDAALDISWTNSSNQIDVIYTTSSSGDAIAGANAVVDAYTEVRQEASAGDLNAALVLLDQSIAEVEDQLTTLQSEIEAQVAEDPTRSALNDQLEEALSRLVELQDQLPTSTGTRLENLRGELDDVSQQIQTYVTVLGLERQNPAMASLLEEQNQTISRKADLLQRKDELSVQARMESDGIVVSSPAISAIEIGVDPLRLGAIGLLLGLVVGAGGSYFLALRRRVFDDRTQPELILEVPLMAEIPNFREERIRRRDLPVRTSPSSVSAEAFRFIAAALEFETEVAIGAGRTGTHLANPDARLVRSFIVVSPTLGDGKSVVAANTALASARQGKRVLVVDADFGYQRLTSLLLGDVERQRGLTDLVEKAFPFEEVRQRVPMDDGARLDLVGRGTVAVAAPDFFRSNGVRTFFDAVREEYDLVIIDSPPMLHVAYATLLVRYADRTIVVIPHGSQVVQAEELANRLDYLETDVMGYVYNKAPLREESARAYGSLEDILAKNER